MLKLMFACPYCFEPYEAGNNHLYQCSALHDRIVDIHPKKKTRRSQPLDSLTHDAIVDGCNCKRCIERLDSNG